MGLIEIDRVLVTDCGSTTTKAILFEHTNQGWRSTVRGEAPTTVEKPLADVTIGATNAFKEVEELWGKQMLSESDGCPLLIRDSKETDAGIDIYLSTSSAGGGLQMIVLGVVGSISARLAEKAALGGGAIVMDTISIDDGRELHEHIDRLRHLRPDIVLIAGGTDGGTKNHPVELAELLLQADPRPRFGETLRIPVIYAGNRDAAEDVKKILGERFQVVVVDNLCPEIGREMITPARDAIHEIFLSHVMSHAPGYAKLLSWSPKGILPTPVAFGQMVSTISDKLNLSVLAVDIGGATTDVFSSLRREDGSYSLNRTVSANLGMSYSIANVLIEAGVAGISRWLPFTVEVTELEDILRNKMIRPTSIPQTYRELLIEQAVAREALRLSLLHHQKLLEDDFGSLRQKGLEGVFQNRHIDSLEKLRRVDLIIGSGGVLSHAPNRRQAALMMLDAFEPLGVTKLAVDSVFMLPHLGVLATLNPEAATEVLLRDCLIPLGTSVKVSGIAAKSKKPLVRGELAGENFTVSAGEIRVVPLASDAELLLSPLDSRIDCGAGSGKPLRTQISGGEVGLIIDARTRIDALRSFKEFGVGQ